MATNFGTKMTITRLPKKIVARCFHLPPIYGPGLCNGVMKILPWRPLLSWQPTALFKDKISCRLTRASNAETQLLSYSVAMKQIPSSTERISSWTKNWKIISSERPRENVSPGTAVALDVAAIASLVVPGSCVTFHRPEQHFL